MSNLLINLRFWIWHFQLTDSGRWRIARNHYHLKNWRILQVHEWRIRYGSNDGNCEARS